MAVRICSGVRSDQLRTGCLWGQWSAYGVKLTPWLRVSCEIRGSRSDDGCRGGVRGVGVMVEESSKKEIQM